MDSGNQISDLQAVKASVYSLNHLPNLTKPVKKKKKKKEHFYILIIKIYVNNIHLQIF